MPVLCHARATLNLHRRRLGLSATRGSPSSPAWPRIGIVPPPRYDPPSSVRRCRFSSEVASAVAPATAAARAPRAFEGGNAPPPVRVAVAMSGGVDSSVAAYLLHRLASRAPPSLDRNDGTPASDCVSTGGFVEVDVVGLHMSNWNALDEDGTDGDGDNVINNNNDGARDDEHENESSPSRTTRTGRRRRNDEQSSEEAPSRRRHGRRRSSKPAPSAAFCEASERDCDDARSVADHLSVPLHRVSFASEYWTDVFEPFVEGLASASSRGGDGKDAAAAEATMPNPDVGCNALIKFGVMRDYAAETLGADYVATGHFARLWHRRRRRDCERPSSPPGENRRSEGRDRFLSWAEEENRLVDRCVREALSGMPEEEWILDDGGGGDDRPPLSPMLVAAADVTKDQSYFLSGVRAEAFRNVLFPLGRLSKSSGAGDDASGDRDDGAINNLFLRKSVRDIARGAGLPTASKRESMGICFIGKRNFGEFISQYLPEPPRPGNFVDVDTGRILGRHDGAVRYTLGQGAKISGAGARYFVCGKGGDFCADSIGGDGGDSTTVYVCKGTHHPALYTDELHVDFDSFNWIGIRNDDRPIGEGAERGAPQPLLREGGSVRLLTRTRHLQPLVPCTVSRRRGRHNIFAAGGGTTPSTDLVLQFDRPMRAVTPGQIAALYAGRGGLICLGGGPIRARGATYMERGLDVSPLLAHPSGHNDLSVKR